MASDDRNDRFDDLVEQLNPVMIVVTTAADGERSGCLVGFHSQGSIDPLRYVVWISRENHTFGLLDGCTHMAVHLVDPGDDEQVAIAKRFGTTTGDEVDKFDELAFTVAAGGVPLIDALPDRFLGAKVTIVDAPGDHAAVVLEPLDTEAGSAPEPLRFNEVSHWDPGHPPD